MNVSPDKKIVRIIDVNLNRAREGLRVVEESARFMVAGSNAKPLYTAVRLLRHQLDSCSRSWYGILLESRDTRQDVGRKAPAGTYASFREVVQANMHRVSEALRVLEEYARIVDHARTPQFQKIRFEVYRLEKKLYQQFEA